jgi:hypothetical protein
MNVFVYYINFKNVKFVIFAKVMKLQKDFSDHVIDKICFIEFNALVNRLYSDL